MQIKWCDYCGTTKNVDYNISFNTFWQGSTTGEITDDKFDICKHCYEELKNNLLNAKAKNTKHLK